MAEPRVVSAMLHFHENEDGTIDRIVVVPVEADAGYFGTRQDVEFWDRVALYLEDIRIDETFPLEWEG